MTDEAKERRIQVVKLADALNAIEGVPVSEYTKVLCLLAKRRESLKIFRLIKQIDPNAFVSQSSVIGVYGEGFDAIKVNVKNDHEKNNIRHQQQT